MKDQHMPGSAIYVLPKDKRILLTNHIYTAIHYYMTRTAGEGAAGKGRRGRGRGNGIGGGQEIFLPFSPLKAKFKTQNNFISSK